MEPLTDDSLREFLAESHEEGLSYETCAAQIVNADKSNDDDC